MASSTSLSDRRRIASQSGYPWPWRVRELVEKHAVKQDEEYCELAEEWGVSSKQLAEWIRRHGFRTENYRVVR